MKKTTVYTTFARALILVLALTLLMGAAALPTGAFDPAIEEYVTWEYFPSTQFVNGKDSVTGEVYRLSPITVLSPRILFMPSHYYYYANKVSVAGVSTTLRAPDHGSDFLMLTDGTVMASNEGKKFLNKLSGYSYGFSEYRLVDGSRTLYSDFSEEDLMTVSNTYGKSPERIRRSLFELRNVKPYTVYGFMEDGWFGVPVAFIYELENTLYYANAATLTDDCFDGKGNLRPKSEVFLNLYPLDEEQTDVAYDGIRRIGYKIPTSSYEDPSQQVGFMSGTASAAATYASVAMLGIVVPVAPITVGLCLPRGDETGRKKRWYLLAILGGAWMALGVITLVLTIVCM